MQSDSGETPLIKATKCFDLKQGSIGNAEQIKLLLRHGADINAKDVNGNTALKMSESQNDHRIVNLLRSYGAK